MGVLHIWALGVGVVITGEYFGWNQGLKEGGPIGMLLASLFVCALYMMWVLALSELSVAMPFAGGPLAYGRRAVGPAFGFVMGWSMFLEAAVRHDRHRPGHGRLHLLRPQSLLRRAMPARPEPDHDRRRPGHGGGLRPGAVARAAKQPGPGDGVDDLRGHPRPGLVLDRLHPGVRLERIFTTRC